LLAAVYALLSSLAWGSSDFLAGLESRRATALGAAVVSQIAAAGGAALVLLVVWPAPPSAAAVVPALLGGVASAIGALSQYRALTLTRMGVVAPVVAAAALVPVAWGIARGEQPSVIQFVGIGFAVLGIVLISRPGPAREGERSHTNRTGVALAVLAGVAYGLLMVSLDYGGEADPYWAVTTLRCSGAVCLVAVVLAWRPALRVLPRALPSLIVVGLLLVAANTLFTAATAIGYLSVVGVLAWLAPAVTIAWAWAILHERLRPLQWLAATLILAGVICLALG